MRNLQLSALGLIATAFAASPAWAGFPVPAAPGPLVGAGIPALIGLAYVYRRIRKSREG
jgi:hypothetical protein